ncbi:MAG TPA: aspartate aminotransferase family protein, partial [Pirellulales bacterium]|nr:aspartate aminotransferase family protein [Pirellulales bacterium]
VRDWPSASRCDTKRFARYFWNLIQRGVYMPCSQYEALFVSTAHTESEIDQTIASAREALAD